MESSYKEEIRHFEERKVTVVSKFYQIGVIERHRFYVIYFDISFWFLFVLFFIHVLFNWIL